MSLIDSVLNLVTKQPKDSGAPQLPVALKPVVSSTESLKTTVPVTKTQKN
jgi:hypothetical protein